MRSQQTRWRANLLGMLATLGALGVVASTSATAVVPTHTFPTLEFQSMITTQPIKGSATTIGDAEGLAADPIRKTIWVLDDAHHAVYEIDVATGTLKSTITQTQLKATPQFQPGGLPFGPPAGPSRPVDMEALAYDEVHDQLFVFAGPCCPAAPHDPTVFRLTRPAAGAAFVPESFQPLLDPVHNDFSGAAARNGVLWVGQGKALYSYDYVSNTLSPPSAPLPIGGSIYGLDFSPDGTELWLTETTDRLYRLTFPALTLVTGHVFHTTDFEINDPRAVEVVGDQIIIANGDDLVSSGSSRRFALHVFNIGHSPPGASFDVDDDTVIAGTNVTFTDTSVRRPVSRSWSFGDGTSTTAVNPVHFFGAPGVFNVTLTATNPNGSSTATRTILVNPAAGSAAFAVDISQGPAPLSVAFTDQTVSPDVLLNPVSAWSWTFGDGSPVEVAQNPTHAYGAPGEYFATLEATLLDGVTKLRFTRRIIVEGPPAALFDTSSLTGSAPLDVTFIDRSTGSPAPHKWRWDFGDGTKSSLQHPMHSYTRTGTFIAKLTVTNADSSAVFTRTVVVQNGPQAAFTASPTSGLGPLSVAFTNTTPVASPPVSRYRWIFGDGSAPVDITPPASANTSHIYTQPGTYTATLAATNSVGTVTATRVINVETVPTASFTADRTSLVGPGVVTFTDTSTGTPSPNAWVWEFGDGTPNSTDQHPTHTFAAAGTRVVKLTVSSPRGTSSATATITVLPAVAGPQASFSHAPAIGSVAQPMSFLDTSTGQPAPSGWRWDFGDGTAPSTDRNPAHTYGAVGTYTVTLAATSAGGTSTTTKQVTVQAVAVADAGFAGLTPARLVDTRPTGSTADGLYAAGGRRGPGSRLDVRVLGRGGVPLVGVGAVALNVTVVDPTDESYLTVWPTGGDPPNASNLNFGAGRTVPNMVVVAVGQGGSVSLFNATGATHVLVDVLGWFPTGSSFAGLTPARLLDTRAPGLTTDGRHSGAGALGPGTVYRLPVLGRGGIPSAGVGSVVLNATAVEATAESYLTLWPSGQPQPNASNVNFPAGRTVPNMVIVPVSADGTISVFNAVGQAHVLIDALGYIPAGPLYAGLTPARIMDTRGPGLTADAVASGGGPIGPGGRVRLLVRGRGGVPATGARSVALNVTAVGASTDSYLTVWPSDAIQPNASNLNLSPGGAIANMVVVPLAADGTISIFNADGSTGILVDVLGWFP